MGRGMDGEGVIWGVRAANKFAISELFNPNAGNDTI